MTETSPIATVSYPRDELKGAGEDERFRRAAMAGVPVPLVDVRIRADDGTDAPLDGTTMGEIQVRGPFITGSYHEVPRTSDKFTDDGWLRTGDVATIDELRASSASPIAPRTSSSRAASGSRRSISRTR